MLIVDNYYLAIQNNSRYYNQLPFAIIYYYTHNKNNTRLDNILPFAIIY